MKSTLQQSFKLAISMALMYWLALTFNWDFPKYGALAIALISLDTTGASLKKGAMRIVGTLFGLAIGIAGVSIFSQNASGMLIFLTTYIAAVSFFMPASRYPYAWYVAGFIPPLVWATTYGTIHNAFDYAVFRFLETAAGIVIYMTVDALVWPSRAGKKIGPIGCQLWNQTVSLFDLYCGGEDTPAESELAANERAQAAGAAMKLIATIDAAFRDTPQVGRKRSYWTAFEKSLRNFGNALDGWRISLSDCRRSELDQVLEYYDETISKIRERLLLIGSIWKGAFPSRRLKENEINRLMELRNSEWNPLNKVIQDLSGFDQATLINYLNQLRALELASIELMECVAPLATDGPTLGTKQDALPIQPDSRATPSLSQFQNILIPLIAFPAGWMLWIFFNPPGGPSLPSTTATFALLVAMSSSFRILKLIPILFAVMLGLVAPIYFLVMPKLNNGPELFGLIFVYVFCINMIFSVRQPLVKTLSLVFFVMLTGISNDQTYSFSAIAIGAQMLLIAVLIVGIVQTIVSPYRPDRSLIRELRAFFKSCHDLSSRFSRRPDREVTQGESDFQHSQALLNPLNTHLKNVLAAAKMIPNNSDTSAPQIAQSLSHSLVNVANRLVAVDLAYRAYSKHRLEISDDLGILIDQTLDSLTNVLQEWAKWNVTAFRNRESSVRDLAIEARHLLKKQTQRDSDYGEKTAATFIMVGAVRGLVDAVRHTQDVFDQCRWNTWAIAKF